MKKPIPFGKYYLLERISVGGMAEVFKAKAFGVEGFERLIAVKRILPSIAEDLEFITMFIDEAKIAVQLNHANIAQIFDLGKVGDSYFIALEYVPGKDLRAIFDRMRRNKELVPIPMDCYVTMKICEGLDYAHNKKDAAGRDLNLVHRDVSPQNVLISYDGEVKIIDFGIAKAAGKAGKTQAGILKGKFGYMSPEQVRGLPLDRRSDIFSVGICLYELLTGERLFIGESDFSTLEKVRNVEIIPPSTYNKRIPEELERIVLKALAKEVEDRYQTAMDLHDDLQTFMYTTGNFFARKDLASFMSGTFGEDIEKEQVSNEVMIGKSRSTSPPPAKRMSVPPPPPQARPGRPTKPRPSTPGISPMPPTPSAPPPGGRVSVPPPPPPRSTKSFPGASAPAEEAPPPSPSVPPPLPVRPTTGSSPRRVAPPPQAKMRTMLGLPSPMAGPGSFTGDAKPLPPDLREGGKVATPIAMPKDKGPAISMDWDEEEPPTHVYDRQPVADAPMITARGLPKPMAATVPLPRSPSAMLDEMEARPTPSPQVGKGLDKRIIFGGIAAALATVLIIIILIRYLGPSKMPFVLTVQPPDAVVKLDREDAEPIKGTSPFVISEMNEGTHIFYVSKEGFLGQKVVVEAIKGSENKKAMTLEKVGSNTGFSLETDPQGAELFIDDRPYGEKTPVTVTGLKPGTFQLRIIKGDQFKPLTMEVTIKDGEIFQIPRKKLELREAEVVLQSVPIGAEVALLDNKTGKRDTLGRTPVTRRLDPSGSYSVEFKIDGYGKEVKSLDFSNNEPRQVIEATLTKEGGAKEGGTPVASSGTGSKHEKKKPKEASSVVSPPSAPSAKGSGFISVQTTPWTKVYIDGKFIRNTPLVRYSLSSGQHTVTCENPDFKITKKYLVTINSGETTTLVRNVSQ